ncbi:Uncharacterised protein [Staphylococcus gallinarum]|uniref:Uncharacterized protein n=1 Tax=Staphylococcus gallinarum TaxID=1293 RepID=A0A380FGJ4_STAGA|nr:Uncharacterised protein [Staphylococcus gallinarum]
MILKLFFPDYNVIGISEIIEGSTWKRQVIPLKLTLV